MNSALAEPPASLQGDQRPSVCSIPPCDSSAGDEAVELSRMAGLELDPWEEFVLRQALLERDGGRWAAFEVGLCVSRQNGKGAILEARELAGLFLLGEKMITHSAHQFDTSLEAFRRLLELIESTPDFDKRVKRVSRSHGEEGIELFGGQRIRFRTRTKGGGRGFSGDLLIYDEAMELSEKAHGALLPILSARPNPQVWYTGSAVDQEVHDNGIVFARVRERGLAGDDPGLAYFEWSVDAESPDAVDEETARDPEAWARANPALGIRISPEYIANEQRSLDARTFAVERLGIGDWPRTDGLTAQVIDSAVWKAGFDEKSKPLDPVCIAFDVTPNRSRAAIMAAGLRADGKRHLETIEHKKGTQWVPDRLLELVERHEPAALLCDGRGPAASLLAQLEALGLEIEVLAANDYARACGSFYDLVEDDMVRHLGTPEIAAAIAGAAQRPLGDAWAWSRKASSVDISPLVAGTIAIWGVQTQDGSSKYETEGVLILE